MANKTPKKPKKPKKFRQARKDAKADSKKVFTGKRKAFVKDKTVRLTASDQEVLREIRKEARGGYLTTDTGERVYSKPTETSQERIARERAESMRKYREPPLRGPGAEEDGKKPKKKATKEVAKKPAVEKPAASRGKAMQKYPNAKPIGTISFKDGKMVFKGFKKDTPPAKSEMTRAERSAANKAAWKNMTPAERKNWAVNKPSAKEKSAAKLPADTKEAKLVEKHGTKKGKAVYKKNVKKPTRAEKSAANKAAWKNMTPEQRKNWKVTRPGAKPAAAAPKTAPVQSVTNVQPEKAGKGTTKPKFVQKKTKAGVAKTTTAAPKTGGTVAVRPKGTVASARTGTVATTTKKATPIKGSDTVVKKKGLLRRAGGAFVPLIVGGEVVSLAKGSTFKDLREINRLKKKLGDKKMSAKEGISTQASNLAALLAMGLGAGAGLQTRRERMDELNRLIKKNAPKELRYGKDGSSLVPGTAAYKAGSKTMPPYGGAKGGGSSGGGSSTKGVYTVKKGDTLWGIAKANNTTVAALREANPKFMKRKKYKQGNMIWSGTTVKIPKK